MDGPSRAEIFADIDNIFSNSGGADQADWGGESDENAKVAKYLLSEKLFLTALELHQELQERNGGPHGVRLLSEFFHDADVFAAAARGLQPDPNGRPLYGEGSQHEAIATRDSRIAVLEYELRCAHEDLAKVSKRLEVTSAPSAASPDPSEESKGEIAPMTWQEEGILACMVHRFLIDTGRNLTAVTLAEEASEVPLTDLELFNLHIGNRASLVELYRGNTEPHQSLREMEDAMHAAEKRAKELEAELAGRDAQIAAMDLELEELRQVVAEGPLSDQLRDALDYLRESRVKEAAAVAAAAASAVEQQRSRPASPVQPEEPVDDAEPSLDSAINGQAHQADETDSGIDPEHNGRTTPPPMPTPSPPRSRSPSFRQENGEEMFSGDALEFVRLVGSTMASTVRHVVIKAREDLIPLMLALIRHHPDAAMRNDLTKTLFTLIKRPGPAQRRRLLREVVELAQGMEPERVEMELLPQIVLQITHKLPERRVMVAEACGAFASMVRPMCRHSLLLSILRQCLQDADPSVRAAGTTHMASLVAALQVEGDAEAFSKFPLVKSMLFEQLVDDDHDVVGAALRHLLPAAVRWASVQDILWTDLVPAIMRQMEETVGVGEGMDNASENGSIAQPAAPTVSRRRWSWYTGANNSGAESQSDHDAIDAGSSSAGGGAALGGLACLKLMSLCQALSAAAPLFRERLDECGPQADEQHAVPVYAFRTDTNEPLEPADILDAVLTGSVRFEKPQLLTLAIRRASDSAFSDNESDGLTDEEEETPSSGRASSNNRTGTAPVQVIWPGLKYLARDCFPQLLQVASAVATETDDERLVMEAAAGAIRSLCSALGLEFTHRLVMPLFLRRMDGLANMQRLLGPVQLESDGANWGPLAHILGLDDAASDGDATSFAMLLLLLHPTQAADAAARGEEVTRDMALAARVMPLFAYGVLACSEPQDLQHHLQKLLVEVADETNDWTNDHRPMVINLFVWLAHEEPLQRSLLIVLWELLHSHSVEVRLLVVTLFDEIVTVMSIDEVERRVLPALLTLANDEDVRVQGGTCRALATVYCVSLEPRLLDKVNAQFETYVEVGTPELRLEVLRNFARVIPQCDQDVRDEFILSKVLQVSESEQACDADTAVALLSAYRAFYSCLLPEDTRNRIVPGLRRLLDEGSGLDSSYRDMVEAMVATPGQRTSLPRALASPSVSAPSHAGTPDSVTLANPGARLSGTKPVGDEDEGDTPGRSTGGSKRSLFRQLRNRSGKMKDFVPMPKWHNNEDEIRLYRK